MSVSIPDSAEVRPGRRFFSRLLPVAGALVVTVVLFSPARQIATVELDPSNYASYSYFAAHELQFGPEVVPMAGPYGFVPYGFCYAGNLFWPRLGLELVAKLVLGGLVVWFVRRSPNRWLSLVWLGLLLILIPFIEDLPYDLAILLTGLCLIEHYPAPGRRSLATMGGLAAYLALLTLFKGTQAMLAVATLGLVGMQAVLMHHYRRLLWILGAYLAALAGLLAAAGQNPLNLPGYLRGMLELSSGYNAAMVLEESRTAFLTGASALLALELLVLVLLLPRWRQPVALAGGLLLAGFTFVEWKHGFVRADGHVYIFYQYASVAALTILLWVNGAAPAVTARWNHWLAGALALTALGLGLWGDGGTALLRHLWSVSHLPERTLATLRQIVTPAREKIRLDAAVSAQRDLFQLPQVQAIVGRERIDFFGTELSYLMLNRLNYRPRPMGGGTFNVFTAWLQNRNTAYVADPATRPDYFLVHPQTIDERFLAQDDPGTLRALLELYSPVATEQGLLLFRARPGKPALTTPRLLGSQPVVLDQPLSVPAVRPDEMLLFSFTLPPSLTGRLRALFYKPAPLYMDLEGAGIDHPGQRRVIPGLFENPVPLSPVIEDSHDLLALYEGERAKSVRRLVLHTGHPGLLATHALQVHFYAAPRPAPDQATASRLVGPLRFVVANVAPLLLEPATRPQREFNGLPVQMLEAPSRLRFALTGNEREIQFKFGLDPEAYLNGRTDGVEFFVELEPPGQPARPLFRRWLRPRTMPADQGTQNQRVVLPPFPSGSTLSLRTSPGPNNDESWDWSYVTGIRLLRGPMLPEQFPRFGRVPVAVNAAVASAMYYEGRELFMLNPPGSVTFALRGDEKKLSFTVGLLPGAYSNGGNSDGVDFLVDLRAPDGTVTRISRHLLDPRDRPSDRGDHSIVVPLPALAPGTQLILTVGPGPAGDAAWDWSYVESLRFD